MRFDSPFEADVCEEGRAPVLGMDGWRMTTIINCSNLVIQFLEILIFISLKISSRKSNTTESRPKVGTHGPTLDCATKGLQAFS